MYSCARLCLLLSISILDTPQCLYWIHHTRTLILASTRPLRIVMIASVAGCTCDGVSVCVCAKCGQSGS